MVRRIVKGRRRLNISTGRKRISLRRMTGRSSFPRRYGGRRL